MNQKLSHHVYRSSLIGLLSTSVLLTMTVGGATAAPHPRQAAVPPSTVAQHDPHGQLTTKEVVRTISYVDPLTKQEHTIHQVARYQFDRKGQLVKSSDPIWPAYFAPVFAGYAPNRVEIPPKLTSPGAGSKNEIITYTKLPERLAASTAKVMFTTVDGKVIDWQFPSVVDAAGQTVATFDLPTPPAGWEYVNGSQLPTTLRITPGTANAFTFLIQKKAAQHESKPVHKPEIKLETKQLLRRIVLHLPAGDQIVTQHATATRRVTVKDGKTTYGKWQISPFDELQLAPMAGYQTSTDRIAALCLTPEQLDQELPTIEVQYHKLTSDKGTNTLTTSDAATMTDPIPMTDAGSQTTSSDKDEESQTDVVAGRDAGTQTDTVAGHDASSQTENTGKDAGSQTDAPATSDSSTQTDLNKDAGNQTDTPTTSEGGTQTDVAAGKDEGSQTATPETTVEGTQTDLSQDAGNQTGTSTTSEDGTQTEMVNGQDANTQTDVNNQDAGTQTPTPMTSEGGTQTDVVTNQDTSTKTATSSQDAGSQTDNPTDQDTGTQTLDPAMGTTSTQTDTTNNADAGTQTAQPHVIATGSQTAEVPTVDTGVGDDSVTDTDRGTQTDNVTTIDTGVGDDRVAGVDQETQTRQEPLADAGVGNDDIGQVDQASQTEQASTVDTGSGAGTTAATDRGTQTDPSHTVSVAVGDDPVSTVDQAIQTDTPTTVTTGTGDEPVTVVDQATQTASSTDATTIDRVSQATQTALEPMTDDGHQVTSTDRGTQTDETIAPDDIDDHHNKGVDQGTQTELTTSPTAVVPGLASAESSTQTPAPLMVDTGVGDDTIGEATPSTTVSQDTPSGMVTSDEPTTLAGASPTDKPANHVDHAGQLVEPSLMSDHQTVGGEEGHPAESAPASTTLRNNIDPVAFHTELDRLQQPLRKLAAHPGPSATATRLPQTGNEQLAGGFTLVGLLTSLLAAGAAMLKLKRRP